MSKWELATKQADLDGHRHDEFIWVTCYYKSHIKNLLNPHIALRDVLNDYEIATRKTKVNVARMDKCGKPTTHLSGVDDYTGKKQYCYTFESDGLGDPFGDGIVIEQIRINHTGNRLKLNNEKQISWGSFVIKYGAAVGADRDERWDANIRDGRDGYVDSDSYLQVGIRTSGFYKGKPGDLADEGLAVDITDSLIRILHRAGDAYHMVAHCGNERMYCDGDVFAIDRASPSRSGIQEEYNNYKWHWLMPADRERLLFGMYWGLYLSPLHLAKFGGRESFRQEFENEHSGTKRARLSLMDLGEGLFVKMTPSPLEISVEFPTLRYESIAPWIYNRFEKAGLWHQS